MPVLSNPKHEIFAQELSKGKSQAESYQTAGYKPSEQHASRLASNGKVAGRVAELQERGALRAAVTVASILDELDDALKLAKQVEQPSAMIAASMGKAKVAGILVDRTEMSGPNRGPIQTQEVSPRDRLVNLIDSLAVRGRPSEDTGKPH